MSQPTHLSVPVGLHDHVQGHASAPITLVEYGDYQCPYCGRAFGVVKAVQAALGDRLRFVFRNMPLNEAHEFAELGAEAAEAAGAQGQFWAMHDALYEHQSQLGPELVLRLAKRLGLDLTRLEDDLRHARHRGRVRADFDGGVRSGVQGTPTFFINGVRYDGAPTVDAMLAALQAASMS